MSKKKSREDWFFPCDFFDFCVIHIKCKNYDVEKTSGEDSQKNDKNAKVSPKSPLTALSGKYISNYTKGKFCIIEGTVGEVFALFYPIIIVFYVFSMI